VYKVQYLRTSQEVNIHFLYNACAAIHDIFNRIYIEQIEESLFYTTHIHDVLQNIYRTNKRDSLSRSIFIGFAGIINRLLHIDPIVCFKQLCMVNIRGMFDHVSLVAHIFHLEVTNSTKAWREPKSSSPRHTGHNDAAKIRCDEERPIIKGHRHQCKSKALSKPFLVTLKSAR
jgi:hypothetical protein